jgi:hypothetical protein
MNVVEMNVVGEIPTTTSEQEAVETISTMIKEKY